MDLNNDFTEEANVWQTVVLVRRQNTNINTLVWEDVRIRGPGPGSKNSLFDWSVYCTPGWINEMCQGPQGELKSPLKTNGLWVPLGVLQKVSVYHICLLMFSLSVLSMHWLPVFLRSTVWLLCLIMEHRHHRVPSTPLIGIYGFISAK